MKYIIIEIQTDSNGTASLLTYQKDNENEALSTYYMKLAAAAISNVPIHAVCLFTNDGSHMMSQSFTH